MNFDDFADELARQEDNRNRLEKSYGAHPHHPPSLIIRLGASVIVLSQKTKKTPTEDSPAIHKPNRLHSWLSRRPPLTSQIPLLFSSSKNIPYLAHKFLFSKFR
jgi:hypothetical protein